MQVLELGSFRIGVCHGHQVHPVLLMLLSAMMMPAIWHQLCLSSGIIWCTPPGLKLPPRGGGGEGGGEGRQMILVSQAGLHLHQVIAQSCGYFGMQMLNSCFGSCCIVPLSHSISFIIPQGPRRMHVPETACRQPFLTDQLFRALSCNVLQSHYKTHNALLNLVTDPTR